MAALGSWFASFLRVQAEPQLWHLWLAALVTIGIYSYLYSDNRLYRLLLNIMLGLGVGYAFMVSWSQTLYPFWWAPMVKGFYAIAGRGNGSDKLLACWAFVGVLGSFWYFQFSRKYLWLSRIVIGLTMGAGAGVVFKQQFLLNMPQISDSFRPLIAGAATAKYQYGVPIAQAHWKIAWTTGDNILYLATIVAVMVYFFFSFSHDKKAVAGTAKFGRWMLMISFGAFFGNTVMTRMGVFLQRLQFLSTEWAPKQNDLGFVKLPSVAIAGIVGGIAVLIYVIYLISRPRQKPPTPGAVEDEPIGVSPGAV